MLRGSTLTPKPARSPQQRIFCLSLTLCRWNGAVSWSTLPSVLNSRAEASSIKAEEKRLADRRRSLENRNARLMQILDRECAGQKTDCGVAIVNYRATSRVEVSDSRKAISWLKRHKHTDCYRTPEPEVSKAEVKKLLIAGENIPGVTLVQDKSCSLK